LQDTLHSDLRRARAAALSMIPTSTGAARAIGLVLPALKGKLDGTAIRVPTANVSLIDLTFDAARETSAEEVNTLMEDAAKSNRLRGIVGINKAPTVSCDFNHDPHSSTFDVTQTQVLDKRFVRILSWYDNEWGFSNRMVEVAAYFGGMAYGQPSSSRLLRRARNDSLVPVIARSGATTQSPADTSPVIIVH